VCVYKQEDLEESVEEGQSVHTRFANSQGSDDKHAFEPSSIPTLRQVSFVCY